MDDTPSTATEMLSAHLAGDPKAAEALMPLVYDELRALARKLMRGERADHTLQATALVHEAFVRLVDQSRIDWKGRTHFFAISATTLRRILVDHARAHVAQKRGGAARRVELHEDDILSLDDPLHVMALDEALTRLGQINARQARVVELRFLTGLTMDETAEALGVSRDTVKLDWRFARAWLNRELMGEGGGGDDEDCARRP